MRQYKQDKINPDIPGVILLSHGPFAAALVETANMVFGESENVAALCFEEGDDADEYRKEATKIIESYPENSVIILDLFGGTPCNQMLRYAQETNSLLNIIAGMNLPMLLQVLTTREDKSGQDFIDDIKENAQKGIIAIDMKEFLS